MTDEEKLQEYLLHNAPKVKKMEISKPVEPVMAKSVKLNQERSQLRGTSQEAWVIFWGTFMVLFLRCAYRFMEDKGIERLKISKHKL